MSIRSLCTHKIDVYYKSGSYAWTKTACLAHPVWLYFRPTGETLVERGRMTPVVTNQMVCDYDENFVVGYAIKVVAERVSGAWVVVTDGDEYEIQTADKAHRGGSIRHHIECTISKQELALS